MVDFGCCVQYFFREKDLDGCVQEEDDHNPCPWEALLYIAVVALTKKATFRVLCLRLCWMSCQSTTRTTHEKQYCQFSPVSGVLSYRSCVFCGANFVCSCTAVES